MIDYTLKFPDEATAINLLEQFTQTHSIDVIGTIYKPTGEISTNEDGEFPITAPIEGWHVNVRGPEATELEMFSVEAKTPVRVWC